MAWYEALFYPVACLLHRWNPNKAYQHTGTTGETSRVKDPQPNPLPSKRINLTQESLVAEAHHAQPPNSISSPQPSSLENIYPPAPAPLSPLLRLPFELRTYIYELALGGNILNVRHKHGKITHVSLSNPDPATDPPPLFLDLLCEPYPIPPWDECSTTGLPLLLTCRAIYRDAIHLLYTCNTFYISDLSVLVRWADMPLLRPQRLAEIRHLSVCWMYYSDPEHFLGFAAAQYDWRTWSRFWDIVARHMVGLKKLELRMEFVGGREAVGVEKEWVKVMLGVRRIKEVTVEIVLRTSSWSGDRCEEVEKTVKDAWLQEGHGPRED